MCRLEYTSFRTDTKFYQAFELDSVEVPETSLISGSFKFNLPSTSSSHMCYVIVKWPRNSYLLLLTSGFLTCTPVVEYRGHKLSKLSSLRAIKGSFFMLGLADTVTILLPIRLTDFYLPDSVNFIFSQTSLIINSEMCHEL